MRGRPVDSLGAYRGRGVVIGTFTRHIRAGSCEKDSDSGLRGFLRVISLTHSKLNGVKALLQRGHITLRHRTREI